MNRTQWTLAGLLVVQGLLLLATSAPWSGGSRAAAAGALLPVLESITPSRLMIEESGDEAESVTLERSGDGWALADRDGYPVPADKVEDLLTKLEELRSGRPVVSSSRYHEALEVTDDGFQRRLRLWEDAADDPKVDLLLGSSPNYRVSHVRLHGEDRVYEVGGLGSYDLRADAASWVERQFVDVPFDDVLSVVVRNASGEFSFERDDAGGEWNAVLGAESSEPLDQAEIDSFVRSLTSLWISKPAGAIDETAQGFTDPAATVEIAYLGSPVPASDGAPDAATDPAADAEGEDATAAETTRPTETLTLRIGAALEGDDAGHYAAKSGFDHAAVISKYDAEKATTKTLADFYPKDDG